MRFEFGFVKKFVTALAVAVSAMNAWSAAVGPLHFDGVDEGQQQKFWDELMSFKMWGTTSMDFSAAQLTDVVGAIGTTGDLKLSNARHTMGGPIYVGGSIYGSNGEDKFTSGPARILGNLDMGANNSQLVGTYCVQGSANDNAYRARQAGNAVLLTGAAARSGSCSPDSVKEVPMDLFIPTLPASYDAIEMGDFNVPLNGTRHIDVPPVVYTATDTTKMYDFHFNNISMNNGTKLTVYMQSAKSLARFFVDGKITLTSSSIIQVVYVNGDATYNWGTHQWENLRPADFKYVKNEDYAGNMLFYTKQDFSMPSMNGETVFVQGTFMSTKTIDVGSNLYLAGQFLANKVVVSNELHGESFRYVPFDPPILKLEPEVGTKLDFPENDTWVKVPIQLDTDPKTDVAFKYCFEFAPDWYFSAKNDDGVLLNDLNPAASLDDVTRNSLHRFPLCGSDLGSVEINEGTRVPKDDGHSIWINVKIDGDVEPRESIRLNISELQGATMPDGSREGSFEIFLIDGDNDPSSDDHEFTVAEDVFHTFTRDSTAKGKSCAANVDFCYHSTREREQASLTIMTIPDRGYLYYKGDTLKAGGQKITVAELMDGALQFRSATNDYDEEFYTSFTFKVADVGDVENGYPPATSDEYTITIKVTPVNDKPYVLKDQVISVKENSLGGTLVDVVKANDDDPGDELKFEFVVTTAADKHVDSLFRIDSKTGEVFVKDGAVLDFESPDSVMTIRVKVTDNASTTDGKTYLDSTETITIKLIDVNEKQSVVVKDAEGTIVKDSLLRVDENSKYPTEVGYVLGDDPDTKAVDATWRTFSYKIVENSDDDEDNDVPFYLNSKTGLIKVDDIKDLVLDYETDSVFVFHVEVTDKVVVGKDDKGKDIVGEFTVIKEVTVKLNDVNETPEFSGVKDVYATFEHVDPNSVVGKIKLVDPDAGELGKSSVTITDNAKVADVVSAEDIFDVSIVKGSADKEMFVVISVKDSALLDYETLYETHYDVDAKAVIFDVTVEVSDKGGESVSTTTKIRVDDVNEDPSTKDDTFEVAELSDEGTEVGQVWATDPDTKNAAYGTIYYSIVENTDADMTNNVPFVVTEEGMILVGKDAALDLEGENSSYVIHVAVTDGVISEPKIATITINLTNVNEPPTITDDGKDWNINEHVAKGTLPAGQNLSASDVDKGDVVTYSIKDASGIFTINPSSGKVSVKDSVKLDYEKYAKSEKETVSFVVTIIATDKDGEAVSLKKTIVINDVNEDFTAENGVFAVDENSTAGTVVGTVIASDPDEWNADFGTLDFSIVDEGVPFVINGTTGQLTVAKGANLDYETKDTYTFKVKITDGEFEKTVDVTVSLNDLNEPPTITDDGNDWIIAEHSKKGELIGTVSGDDVDGGDNAGLSYSLKEVTAGAEVLFTVNAKGEVVVKDSAKLDYETLWSEDLYDAASDMLLYEVAITVTDEDGEGMTITKVISVRDVNETPVAKNSQFDIDENSKQGATVGTVVASDPDTKHVATFGTLSYSIDENTDASSANNVPFSIDGNGKITVDYNAAKGSSLDFESKASYTFNVTVTDGEKSITVKVVVDVNDVPEKPEFADHEPKLNVDENTLAGTKVGVVAAVDDDCKDDVCAALTYELAPSAAGNTDYTFFAIDNKGQITVKADSSLNYEQKNVYTLDVIVYDGKKGAVGTLMDTAHVTININDVNDAPVLADKTLSVPENSVIGDTVGMVKASDEDTWAKLTYSLADIDSKDAVAELFAIDPSSGVIVVAKNNSLDFETRDEYKVLVIVKDNGSSKGFEDLSDTAEITIKLTDVPEKPEIVDDGKTKYDVNENSKTGLVVAQFEVIDQDAGEVLTLKPSIIDRDKAGADTLFNITLKNGKIVVTVANGSVLDYETLNHSYNVTFKIVDDAGLEASIDRVINIIDVNEAPTVADFEKTIEENLPNGKIVGSLVASDPDIFNVDFNTLTYSVVENGTPFKMDNNKIVVANSEMLNYEKDSVFVFHVRVTDGTLSDTATVKIKLSDVDENPEIVQDDPSCDENKENCHKCDAMIEDCDKPSDPPPTDCTENCGYVKNDTVYVNVRENSVTGTKVLEYYVKDEDAGDLVSMKVAFSDDSKTGSDSLFEITKSLVKDDKGYKFVLTVKDGDKLDYESINPTHTITITVTDDAGLEDKIVRVINVVDVNEAPIIVKQNFDFDEHNATGSTIGKIEWGDDLDTKDPSFRDNKVVLIGGDTTKFAVDPTGVITTKASFNYETDPTSYELIVKVVDKNDPNLFVVDTMKITVNNVPETPQITSKEFTIPENPSEKAVVGVITSRDLDDLDDKENRTYTLVSYSDFVNVTSDGKIVVMDSSKFDFETTESFKIKVKVTDPTGKSSEETIVVNIGDVNEAPSIVDQTIKVPEDTKKGSVVDTVKATDPDKATEFSTLQYTVVGGDTATFKVDSKTGVVTLKDSLDYETKNEYKLVVEVFDGEFRDTATVTIKVENVIEKSVVEITLVDDGDSVYVKPDSVFTNRPTVKICWDEGREVCAKSKCEIKSAEVCQDTTLTEGPHTIVKEFKDPTTDVIGRDTVVVFVSTSSPIVTVSANGDTLDAANIYTIEETVREGDSSIYVNDTKNDIRVTIKDPVTKKDSSFVVKLDLDNSQSVSTKELAGVTSVAETGNLTLNLNPASGETRTPVNGTEVKVSYTEEVNGKKVTVSYVTDNDGEVVKTPVVNEKGEIDSIEVITVSTVMTVGGREVTVSYQADAVTGQVLNVASDGTLTTADKIVIANSSSSTAAGSSSSSKGNGSSSSSKGGSSSSSGKGDSSASEETVVNVGVFKVTYDYVDENGNSVVVTYTVDEKGNIVKNGEGDVGYEVSYTYTNKFGNSATQSVYIVLDQVGPKVEILYPANNQVVHSNFVEVTWTVNGVEQDTLTMQGLEKGYNKIKRFYRDKAGNAAYDSVIVIMKDAKDVAINVEQPVTEITLDKVEEYYKDNPPKKGETIAVSIRNPSTGLEMETQTGGSYGTKTGSGEAPYPGVDEDAPHLGPTIVVDVKMPVVNSIGGLATLDDLVGSDGLVSLDGVDAKNAEKVSIEEYVETYCESGFKYDGDMSRVNLYRSRMDVKIWIYTTIGDFVDYYNFRQDLNDPDYTNEAGLLNLYLELKPDKDGEVRTESGRAFATGAYLYKVETDIRNELRCTLPPVKDASSTAKKKGDVIKKSEEMLKSFGYKRPEKR